MSAKKLNERNEGMALLLATIFLVVGIIVLGALSMRTINQSRHVDNYIAYEKCFIGVESGLARSQSELDNGDDGWVGLDGWTMPDSETGIVLPAFDDPGVVPEEVATMPGIEFIALADDWSDDGFDNNGDGTTDGADETGYFSVYSLARNDTITRAVEVVLGASDVNVWNNAIFAAAGAAGGVINGNVSISGSVHVLGNNVIPGGDSIVVIDMSGTSFVHNNYGSLADARLINSVPSIPEVPVNGEDSDTLAAKLRVKRGRVSLNGNSEMGEADTFGNGRKDTLDAIYNEDGWTGNQVIDDGDRGDPKNAYSDNGWDDLYDLSDRVPFPEMDDPWKWPANVPCYDYAGVPGEPGSTEVSPDGDPYQHGEFFGDVLSDGNPYNGDVSIQTGTSLYLNLTQNKFATGAAAEVQAATRIKQDKAGCVTGDDYIYYNKNTKVMEINGQVHIDGNLSITGSGGNKTVYYTGRAAMLVSGDVTLDTNLYTCNNGDPNNFTNSFPANNVMGLMSLNNMYVGTTSQLKLMGAFYADKMIKSNKQTIVMGTYVSNYFDMGSQVPEIYQVPDLAKYLPFGMIGNYPLWVYSPISWREITP